ncbi:hypothetical protein HK096_001699, partial [Nowakowskiella sp. JEL0078]
MPALKVLFQDAARILEVESPVSWHAFELNIRAVHNIPAAASLLVRYVDSEGDLITLDTDLELSEAIRVNVTQFTVVVKSLPNLDSANDYRELPANLDSGLHIEDSSVPPPLPPYTFIHEDPPIEIPKDDNVQSNASNDPFQPFLTGLEKLVGEMVHEIQQHPDLMNQIGSVAQRVAYQTYNQVQPLFTQMRDASSKQQGNCGRGGWGRR